MKNFEIVRREIIESEVISISRRFDREGLRFLFLKGLPFSVLLYDDRYSRKFSDIDLLIDEKDRNQVIATFEELGYVNTRGWIPKEIAKQVTMRKIRYGINIDFDLHYELTQFRYINERFNFDKLFNYSIKFELNEYTLRSMDYLSSLNFSIYHLELEVLRGNSNTDKWFEDIYRLTSKLADKPFVLDREVCNYLSENKNFGSKRYLLMRFLESKDKLTFINETMFPPLGELIFSGRYKSRLHRLFRLKRTK